MVLKQTLNELKEHIPFTIIATFSAVLFVFLTNTFLTKTINQTTFEIIHPAHVLVSAIATTALFHKYKNKFFKSILIGITGSLIIGTTSDILFPYLGGILFNLQTSFHFPLIEKPVIILGSAILGSLIGIKTKESKFPHFLHVLLSVFASLFYLITYSSITNTIHFMLTGIIIFIAVIIPCCLSDIIYPLLFINSSRTLHKKL